MKDLFHYMVIAVPGKERVKELSSFSHHFCTKCVPVLFVYVLSKAGIGAMFHTFFLQLFYKDSFIGGSSL